VIKRKGAASGRELPELFGQFAGSFQQFIHRHGTKSPNKNGGCPRLRGKFGMYCENVLAFSAAQFLAAQGIS